MIRQADINDLAAIYAIEQASFSDPWSEEALRSALASGGAVRVLVHCGEEKISGFIIFSLVGGEAEIQVVAVAPESRKMGVGSALIGEVLSQADAVFLDVRRDNIPAMALYEKFGFKPVYVRKNYYGPCDAVVMTAKGAAASGTDTRN